MVDTINFDLTPDDLDRVSAVLGEERLKTTLDRLEREVDQP